MNKVPPEGSTLAEILGQESESVQAAAERAPGAEECAMIGAQRWPATVRTPTGAWPTETEED